MDDTPILHQVSNGVTKILRHGIFSLLFAINREILHIYLVYLYAGRINTQCPSIWIGSVDCCDTRTSTASNQPTNPATRLTNNKRRRLAFSIHFLSSATFSTLFFFAHAESNLVTRNNGCVPASIVHILLQRLFETFSNICKYYQTIQNKRHHKFVPLLVHRSAHLIFD